MGYKLSNVDGVFIVETPEGHLMATNSGVILQVNQEVFLITSDTFSVSFKLSEIQSIDNEFGNYPLDKVDAFNHIIKLFPK